MPFLAFVLKLCREEDTEEEETMAPWDEALTWFDTLRADIDRCGLQALMVAGVPSPDAGHISLRVTCYETRASGGMPPLLQTLSTHPLVHIGHTCYTFESLDIRDPFLAGVSSWADILTTHGGSAYMRFSFVTPVITARMRTDASSPPDALPFPEPIVLFTSILQQWNALGGPPLSSKIEHLVEAARCTISDHRLRTVEVVRDGQTRVGYLGGIEYECQRKNRDALAALTALTRLAFFVGSGYGIEHVLGATMTTILN